MVAKERMVGLLLLIYVVDALQRQNTEILKQIFPEKEYRGLCPSFHVHESVRDLYVYSHDRSAYSVGGNM